MIHRRHLVAMAVAAACSLSVAQARDWYVSAASGKGKKGTKDKPVSDLGNILTKLEPGDRIFLAEGTYLGRGENGRDEIVVPVEIYGGFSEDFSKRDPWGAHKTIMSGSNSSDNWEAGYRISVKLDKWNNSDKWPAKGRYDEPVHRIVVDGLIVDNGARNRYKTAEQHCIVRTANPKQKQMPTPESGGISVSPWKSGDAVVRNCVVINTAPTQGVIALWGNKNSRMLCENNMAINNTGNGIQVLTSWHPRDGKGQPRFVVRGNTSLFNHKHDPFATYGGAGLKSESDCRLRATGNVLGFNDYYAYDNALRSKDVIFNDNHLFASAIADYVEFDTRIPFDKIEDESDLLEEAEDNINTLATVPISPEWTKLWLARTVIDRNAAEADVKAVDSWQNSVRGMLGLNLKGTDLKVDSEVWLPRLQPDDALKCAGAFGTRGAKMVAASGGDVGAFDLDKPFGDFENE